MGVIPIVLLFFIAAFGPYLTPYDFLAQDFTARLVAPSSEHLLGTDELGRDVFSRILYGARTAVSVGLISTAISLIVGLIMGSLAGYLGGQVDILVVWLTDVTRSMPALLLAIVINLTLKVPLEAWLEQMYLQTKNTFFRQTMWVDLVLVFGALALIQWPGYARLIRGQILSIRSRNYVLAARALGMPTGRILTRYVIPNAMGPLIVAVSAGLGGAMVLESAVQLSGRRCAAAYPQLGQDDQRRPAYVADSSLPAGWPGGDDGCDHRLFRLAGRRPERCPQSPPVERVTPVASGSWLVVSAVSDHLSSNKSNLG